MRAALPLLSLAPIVAAALGAAACRTPAPEIELSAPTSEPIPNAEFTTHDGRTVRFYDDLVRGRVVVIQFFFVDCQGVCPISTGRLVAMQAELGVRMGHEISFVSVTLDPEHDTPAVLAEHASTIGAGPGWTFVTGRKEDVETLRRRLGVFDLDPVLDADKNQHAGVLVFGNDPLERWSMKPATLPAQALVQALARLARSGA